MNKIKHEIVKQNKDGEIFYRGKVDRVFKATLCNEENQELLEEFLGRILKRKVKIVKYLRNEQPVNTVIEKVKIVDLLVLIENMLVHVELNNITNEKNIKSIQKRNFTYVASDYVALIKRGETYNNDTKIVAIDLTYGIGENQELIRYFSYQDKTGEKYTDDLETLVINMDKAMKFWYDKNIKEIENNKHLIMLDMDKQGLKRLAKGDELVMKFAEKITDLNENQQFRQLMSTEEDSKKLEKTFIENARKDGEEIGIMKGRKEGRISGIKEEQTKILNNMLKNGFSIIEMSKITNLTPEEINKVLASK